MINSVLAIIYSLVSILPVTFLVSTPYITIFLSVLISIVLLPLLRAYIRDNITEFEFNNSTTPSLIIVFLFIISLVLSLLYDRSPYGVLRAVPLFLTLYFIFLFSIFDFTNNYKDPLIFKVKFYHLKITINIIFFFMIIKFLILLILIIYSIEYSLNFLWLISFLADVLVIINKRRELYIMKIYQEGFYGINQKLHYNKWVYIIFLIPIIISLIVSKSFSILPYTVILGFLTSLFKYKKLESPADENDLFGMHEESLYNREMFDEIIPEPVVSPYWARFWEVLTNVVIFISVLFLIYLLLKPLIKPLFNKKYKRVSLKIYYKDLLAKLIAFFKTIFLKNEYELKLVHKNIINNITIKKTALNKLKMREVNRLIKYYLKLIKWYYKKEKLLIPNITVDDFFQILMKRYNLEEILFLNEKFNLGFYSNKILGEDLLNKINSLISDLISNRLN